MNTRHSRRASAQSAATECVLDVLQHLRRGRDNRALDTIDLEELALIDGEFLWRCCRLDFVAEVNRVRERFGVGPDRPGRHPDDYLAFSSALDDFWVHYSVAPTACRGRVLDDAPIPLRLPTYSFHVAAHDLTVTESMSIEVLSGAWTGEDVAQRVWRVVERQNEDPDPLWKPIPVSEPVAIDEADVEPGTVHSVQAPDIRFAFSLYPKTPSVTMTLWMPLPPPQSIAGAYDGVVRDVQGWHRLLPGVDDRQTLGVALRTWVVALLQRAGVRYQEAMDTAHHVGGLPYVERAGYYADLKKLRQRVREAAPCLPETRPTSKAKSSSSP